MRQRLRAPRIPEDRRGVAAVAAAAALWAIAAIVARDLFERGVPPIELAAARAVIAALGLALLVRHRRPGAPRGGWVALVALGLSIALVNAAYYLAIERLAVAVAIVIQYTAPGFVVAWTWAATRRAPAREVLIALLLAVAGVALVSELPSGDLGRLDLTGLGFGIASAVLFAAYTILSEHAGARHGPLVATARGFAVASVFWLAIFAFRGVSAALVAPENVARILFVGVAGTLSPFLLYVWGIRRVRAERATIAATLEPVLAAVFAWVLLSQALGLLQIAGGALVLAGVVLLQTRRRAPVRPPEP